MVMDKIRVEGFPVEQNSKTKEEISDNLCVLYENYVLFNCGLGRRIRHDETIAYISACECTVLTNLLRTVFS